jgi:hypothetical protein
MEPVAVMTGSMRGNEFCVAGLFRSEAAQLQKLAPTGPTAKPALSKIENGEGGMDKRKREDIDREIKEVEEEEASLPGKPEDAHYPPGDEDDSDDERKDENEAVPEP